MSWSVSAVGKAAPVAAKLAQQLAAIKCMEPEETIKSSVASAIATALAVFPPNLPVMVSASGSQHAPDSKKPEQIQNQLSVKIDPLYGFVE